MKNLRPYLTDYTNIDIRESLYYLGRFLKQAESFENYSKDIFDDAFQSEPNQRIKDLTRTLINKIEEFEGKLIKDFNDNEVHYWMNHIDEIESNLEEDSSETSINNAINFLRDVDVENIKINKEDDDKLESNL